MKRVMLILSLLLLLMACEKNDAASEPVLKNGLYKGTFNRTAMDTVDVSISILEGNFEGSSERQFYPAICRGSFAREGSVISFHDSCTWQANFDWTLILNGRYEFSVDGESVHLWKQNGTTVDEFRIRRLTR
jgi:hypothetical protein